MSGTGTAYNLIIEKKDVFPKITKDLNGEILAISQFTLYANAKKGRRPSYIEALKNTEAIELYNIFIDKLKESNLKIATGIFGADMLVNIKNDGPFTILLDSNELS